MGPPTKDPIEASAGQAGSARDASTAAPPDASKGLQWLQQTMQQAWTQVSEPRGLPVVGMALAILVAGLVIFCTVPTLYARIDTRLARLPPLVIAESPGKEALEVATARAALYPLADGGRALVVRGEVVNKSDQPEAVSDALLVLKDDQGAVVAQSRAPLGFSLPLLSVFHLTDDRGWQDLVQGTRAIGRAPLAPRATASFMLVVVRPPEVLLDVTPEISLP